MEKKQNEPAPGDGLRSLRSTMLFRAVNYELYVKPNNVIMFIGAVTMLSSIGYIVYMRQKFDRKEYYNAVAEDGSVVLTKKKSKWAD